MAAALDAAPGYVREEVGRLLPAMGRDDGTGPAGRDGEWSRQRLFAGVAELLTAVAGGSPSGVGLVVEDVHWADGETLDLLTFLARAGRRGPVRIVATCRGDEAPLAEHVAGWLARMRGDAGTEEIRLGPLSRAEVAGQAAALAGGPVSPQVAGDLFARAEGNAFFTEQLVAAALAGQGGAGGGLRVPAGLPSPAGGAAGGAGGPLRRGRPGGAGGPGGREPEPGRGRAGHGHRAGGRDSSAGVAGTGGGPAAGRGRFRRGAPATARAAGRGGGRPAAARRARGAARAYGERRWPRRGTERWLRR